MNNKIYQSIAFALVLVSTASTGWGQDAAKADEAKQIDKADTGQKTKHSKCWREDFGASFQIIQPQHEMKTFLAEEKGYGVGLQWWHELETGRLTRTRLEWNAFSEGAREDGSKGKVKQYLIGWDHLFKLNQGNTHAYLVVGAGGVRWCLEDIQKDVRHKQTTTKLQFTAGMGVRVSRTAGLEARYVVSSVNKRFDGNMAQLSLSWVF